MRSKLYNYSDEEFKIIIESSNSYSECCRKIGFSTKGRYGSDKIKERCEQLNIPTSHFGNAVISPNIRYSLDEILVQHSLYRNISRLKIRLIKEKKLKYQCARCGNIGLWNNESLTLELDHINGCHDDHRIENLRFLCPNCHSQTATNAGKNKTIPC